MGQLTFQATLGGAVNLVGPNTAATTNFTLPSVDGSSGQALTTNASGTLAFANIALASAVSGTLPIVNGGTNSTATATAGGVGYGTGTAHAYTAAGTDGYFLKSNGASAPSWVTAPTGPVALLATVNATSGTYVTFNGYFTSDYDVYLVTGSNFLVDDTTTASNLRAQIAIAGTFQTANYKYTATTSISSTSTLTGFNSGSSDAVYLDERLDLYRATGLNLYLYNPLSTNGSKSMTYTISGTSGSLTLNQAIGAGVMTGSSSAISGIRFFWASGTFQAGKFQLYGLKNS
jgi:hypothetical protein